MKYVNNKLVLSNKEKDAMFISIEILYYDQCSRGDYKQDMITYKAYIVIHALAVQFGVIGELQFCPIKPVKKSY